MVVDVPLTIYIVVAWTLFWKAIGLWKSARNNQMIWFVLIMFLYTFGILPLIYVLWLRGKEGRSRRSVKKVSKNVSKVSKKVVKKGMEKRLFS